MAKFLVTGGAGFIGSNLVEALVERGAEVSVLDDFSTGRRENLEPWRERVRLFEGSLTDLEVVRSAVVGVDFVLHQGALPSVPKSVERPLDTHAVNVNGTLNVLIAARDAGVRRVVYAASSSAYGNTPTLPKVETMPASPRSPYAVQKHAGELYCRVFFETYGLETVALRYFNIFGPRQDPQSPYSAVIPKFAAACLRDRSPTIFGDGETSRDFTFIENVVSANLLACEAPAAAAGRVFNVACGERISLNALAAVIREKVGQGGAPVHQPERAGDVKHSLADIALAKEHLGYTPKVKFAEGIERTVAYYREILGSGAER
ncbi:MAG: SDR family oxidoreductase [Myxococcota bacterium]